MVLLQPECTMFSAIQELFSNADRVSPEVWSARWGNAVEQVSFSMQIAQSQHERGRKFLFEHPEGACSWRLNSVQCVSALSGVVRSEMDMCAVGMTRASDGEMVRKPPGILTNDEHVARELSDLTCDGTHTQVPSLGGSSTHAARIYPPKLCEAIVRSVRKSIGSLFKSEADTYASSKLTTPRFPVEVDSPGEDEGEDPVERETLRPAEPRSLPTLTASEKTLLSRTHVNLGNPATDLMLCVFRAAKARPEVLRYIQDEFSCPDCASHPRHRAHRRAAMPRTYQFNKVVGCDTFKVTIWEAPSTTFRTLPTTERTIRWSARWAVTVLNTQRLSVSHLDDLCQALTEVLRSPRGPAHRRWNGVPRGFRTSTRAIRHLPSGR